MSARQSTAHQGMTSAPAATLLVHHRWIVVFRIVLPRIVLLISRIEADSHHLLQRFPHRPPRQHRLFRYFSLSMWLFWSSPLPPAVISLGKTPGAMLLIFNFSPFFATSEAKSLVSWMAADLLALYMFQASRQCRSLVNGLVHSKWPRPPTNTSISGWPRPPVNFNVSRVAVSGKHEHDHDYEGVDSFK